MNPPAEANSRIGRKEMGNIPLSPIYPPHRAFWQARFYDFNVWTTKKRVEKLRYMHRNPVKRGLVGSPEQWGWSSYRFYFLGESGAVRINEGWGEISFRGRAA